MTCKKNKRQERAKRQKRAKKSHPLLVAVAPGLSFAVAVAVAVAALLVLLGRAPCRYWNANANLGPVGLTLHPRLVAADADFAPPPPPVPAFFAAPSSSSSGSKNRKGPWSKCSVMRLCSAEDSGGHRNQRL